MCHSYNPGINSLGRLGPDNSGGTIMIVAPIINKMGTMITLPNNSLVGIVMLVV